MNNTTDSKVKSTKKPPNLKAIMPNNKTIWMGQTELVNRLI